MGSDVKGSALGRMVQWRRTWSFSGGCGMCVVGVGGRKTLGSDTRCCYFFPTDTPPAALGAKMEGEIPAAPSSTRRCTPSSATTKESSSFQPGSLAVCGSVSSELVNNEAPIMQYRQPHELAQHSIELPQKHHTNKYIKQPHHHKPDRPAPRASQLSPVPFSPKYGLRTRCRQRATWATAGDGGRWVLSLGHHVGPAYP